MKKSFLLLFVSTLLMAQHVYAAKSVWDGKKTDTSWYNESASEYHITSAAQFKGFADLVSYNNCSFEGKKVILDCDIDLDNHPWSPIGLHSGKPFSGTFDGLNHSITNLLINSNQFEYPDMKDNVGLFGYAIKAEIKNVSVQGKMEISYGKYIGGIAAMVKSVENLYGDIEIELNTSLMSSYVGTVVSYATDAKKIYAKGNITFKENYLGLNSGCYVGGIAGSCTNMSECYSAVDASINIIGASNEHIGGISGASGTISNALFAGQISVGNYNCSSDMFMPNIGGICGQLTTGDHLISAPKFMSYGRGFAIAKSVVIPSTSNAAVTDTYYLNTWATNNESYGAAISDGDLKSGTPLAGFDTTVWEFKENEYPSIISLASFTSVY